MILQIFSVKDLKADAFASPFFFGRVEVAVRTFADALTEPGHPMSAHPDDYVLYQLGAFDDETGMITSNPPVLIVHGDGQPPKEA